MLGVNVMSLPPADTDFDKLIQVNDHAVAITIVNGALSQTDTITINGVACAFTSDATPTKKEISDGLIAAIQASVQAVNVLVSQGAGPNYDIIIKTANNLDPTVTVSANLADTPTVGIAILSAVPCRLFSLSLNAVSTGAISIYDGATLKQTLPIGLLALPTGDTYTFLGCKCYTNLGIKVAQAADVGCVFWRPGLTG